MHKTFLNRLTLFRYGDIIYMVIKMNINQILQQKNITKYRLAKESGISNATLSELCAGKTRIEKCSAETLYKLAKSLDISMESLVRDSIKEKELREARERSFEVGLPVYLQHDLDAFKEGQKNKSSLMDCFWGELYGSINIAEINENAITHEHAEYLRNKYLRR